MHGCQGKNAAKVQEILPFSIVFNRFMIKKLAAVAKKSLANYKKDGIIPDGKAELLLNVIKKDPTEVESKLPLLQLYSLERK